MHSDKGAEDPTKILERYESGECRIIVSVDMLNEGHDMPDTRHVVFARGTDSEIVFKQQF